MSDKICFCIFIARLHNMAIDEDLNENSHLVNEVGNRGWSK